MRKILLILLAVISIISCTEISKNKVDVSNIAVDATVARFDVDFYTSSPSLLPRVKKKYPMLFPHDVDSIWVGKMQDKDEQELFIESQKLFKDFSSQEKELEKLLQHIIYYNPKFITPTIVTMLTNMDSRVVYTTKYLFISLDNFLGKEHKFYADFPNYIKAKNTKEHLIVAVANAIIEKQMSPNPKRRFIDKMIYEGKKMYLLDAYLPDVKDQEKIGYDTQKYEWAKSNEENVWRYFIDKDILYSTDSKLDKRFLDLAPFSKFYTGQDNQSPGQIGVYLGWQIVRAYMQNNAVSLHQLMKTSEDIIFKKSKYKPKR